MRASSPASFEGQVHTQTPPGRIRRIATRVGLIGYGYWGVNHCRVLAGLPHVELTVIESRPERLLEARNAFPDVNLASDLAEVQDQLDAVVIATPSSSHRHVALRALRAGLHILVEKPLATSVADAEEIVETADAAGLTLMVGHTFEYHAAVRKLKQIIESGELGRILYIDMARLRSGPGPRDDCNVIWDLAPHDVSIATYLLDEFPETVRVWAQHNLSDVHADVAYLRMDFPRAAASAFVHVRWLSADKVRRVTVVGDQRTAVFDDLCEDQRIRIFDEVVDPAEIDERAWNALPVIAPSGDVTSPDVQFVEPLLVQDSHFIESVRACRRPDTSGDRGLGVVGVLAATDEAVISGAPILIPPSVDIPTAATDEQAVS